MNGSEVLRIYRKLSTQEPNFVLVLVSNSDIAILLVKHVGGTDPIACRSSNTTGLDLKILTGRSFWRLEEIMSLDKHGSFLSPLGIGSVQRPRGFR